MSHQKIFDLILEINQLKSVYRNTITEQGRRESTAEHSWSVGMILLILMRELKTEFTTIDELKTIKLALIHDIVEIYAGDVIAFDHVARKEKEKLEIEALNKLADIYPIFGEELSSLWHEFEAKETLEAKIAKAADSICPIFKRLHAKQSYVPFNVTIQRLDETKKSIFSFSKTFDRLYQQLKSDLVQYDLIKSN